MDELLVEACFGKKLKAAFFSKNQYGLFLNKEGKAFLIPLFNDYLRSELAFLGTLTSVRNHIHGLAGKLSNRIRTTFE